MPWVRSDDLERRSLKFLGVSTAAFGFHQAAKQWAAEHLTDGFIPQGALGPDIYVNATREQAVGYAKELAEATDPTRPGSAPVWEVADGGYQIHDFLAYNPSRRVTVAKRQAAREARAAAGRNGGEQTQASRRQRASIVTAACEQRDGSVPACNAHAVAEIDHSPSKNQAPDPDTRIPSQETSSPAADGAAAPPKPRHPVREPDIRAAVKYWAAAFEQHRGVPPVIHWPKACGQLKPVVLAHGLEGTTALLDQLFRTDDRLVRNSDYGLGVFAARVNKLAAELHGAAPPLSPRGAAIVGGLRRALAEPEARP